jgi:hypothetical protein
MFDWATKASGNGCYCKRKHDHALGGVKSSDFFTSTCVLAIVSVAQATKAKEPEIILPVPQVESERPGPEVPPDNDAPERESPSRAGKGAFPRN